MLFARLPNPDDPASPRAYPWGRETIVVHDRATAAAYGRHTAPFSLKTVLAGAERYNVHGFVESVEPGECLVVNDEQTYESEIDAEAPVETLCIFFSRQDAHDARRAAIDERAITDDPDRNPPGLEFAGVKRAWNAPLASLVLVLPSLSHAPALARGEHCARLLHAMLAWEQPQWALATRLDALRAATRAELLRRCLVGRALIDAQFQDDLTLAQLAQAAGLSRTHFLRAFKRCFGQTPYQALRRRRLASAAAIIRSRRCTVSEAALAVGYGDFSAFARAFRVLYGVAPSRFTA